MDKKVAIVICHFNKIEFGLKCIQSVFDSTYRDYDLIVVDNASTDNSATIIKENYGDTLLLIENEKNLGGSGGFNTGIKKALEKNYKYVLLLDNDAYLKHDAIENLVTFMDKNDKVAIAGTKLYRYGTEDVLQEYGSFIDFENKLNVSVDYYGFKDPGNLPEVVECDFVPFCAAITRTEVIKKYGMLPEENFIYWDDMELGYRFKRNGYKIVVYGKAIAWHNMGTRVRVNTFSDYYFSRNRIRFFAKYLKKEKIKDLCERMLLDVFQCAYMCKMYGIKNIPRIKIASFWDAVNSITGNIGESVILPIDSVDKIQIAFKDKEKLQIFYNGSPYILKILLEKIHTNFPQTKIKVIYGECEEVSIHKTVSRDFTCIYDIEKLKELFPDEIFIEARLEEENTTYVQMCSHISDIKDGKKGILYVDEYLNYLETEQQFEYSANYEFAKDFFMSMHYDLVYDRLLHINNLTSQPE